MSVIYLRATAGDLIGPVLLVEVPGIGCQMPDNAIELEQELRPPPEGFAWALVDDAPALLADHRGMVFSTQSGEPRQHTALGELPEGLTALEWPGRFYVWSGDSWVLDEAAQLDAILLIERTWRNGAIASTDYLVMPDYPISAEQRTELYAYRQALRDWPSLDQFPDPQARPLPPIWVLEQSL